MQSAENCSKGPNFRNEQSKKVTGASKSYEKVAWPRGLVENPIDPATGSEEERESELERREL